MTAITDTDVYGFVTKGSAIDGNLSITGLTEGQRGLLLRGLVTADNTEKASTADAAVVVRAGLKSGTTFGNCGADGNLMAIQNNGTTRFIFDAEGSAHAEIEWIAFDKHDDIALLDALNSIA